MQYEKQMKQRALVETEHRVVDDDDDEERQG